MNCGARFQRAPENRHVGNVPHMASADLMKKFDTFRALILLALIAAAVAGLFVLSVNAPLRESLGESLGWFRGWTWGPVVFAAVYAVSCLVLPGSLITLAAGSLFGIMIGTVVVSLGSVTGACLA